MKKFNVNGFMIAVSFFLTSFFVVVFVNQLIVNRQNNRNYDMYNGPASLKMRITCAEPFLLTPQNYGNDFVIYHILSESNIDYDSPWVRVVYGKGDFPTPKMLTGSFFTEEQLLSAEPLCVVGSRISENSTEKSGNDEYFTYEGISYRVIGHMGTGAASDLDVMVMLNWGGYFAEKEMCSGLYLIDSDNASARESAYAKVKEAAESAEGVTFLPLAYKTTIRSFDAYSKAFYPIAIIILVLSIVVLGIFYIRDNAYQIAVKKLVGISMPMLYFEIILKFVKFALFGLGAALISMVLLQFNNTYSTSEIGYFTAITPQTVIFAVIASVLLAVILSLPPIVSVYRLDTSEQIK